ncbi:MAG: glycosyltransferase family A protein [Perlabentimonas sp.]
MNATYNEAEWVENLLDSLVRQTYPNIEVLVIGDGCTDNTEDVVKECKRKNPDRFQRIEFINKEHTGVQETRNRGLDEATGNYIIFPDSDCYLYDNCLTEMQEELSLFPHAAYVYCDMENVGFYSNIFRAGEFSEQRLRQGNFIPVVSLMYREGAPRWDPKIKRLQDYDLWLSWLDKGFYGKYIPKVLFRHNTRKNSLTFTSIPINQAYWDVHKKHGICK